MRKFINKMNFNIIKYVNLTEKHTPTLRTIHKTNNKLISAVSQLQIVRYPDDKAFYLLYLNSTGDELTDTYHQNIQNAYEQAKWEFNIPISAWKQNKLQKRRL